MAPTNYSSSARIIYWAYTSNAILQLVDVIGWLHPPLLAPEARDPVAQMFVRGQSVLLAPLLLVFWLFRNIPLHQERHHNITTTTNSNNNDNVVLGELARGVAFSFGLFHVATIAWIAASVYGLRTEMSKTHLIFCFHGLYAFLVTYAYILSRTENIKSKQ